jgi:hypothetical protein
LTSETDAADPPKRVVASMSGDLAPRVWAIPFERVWRAARAVVEAEGATIERDDGTAGVLVGSGRSGFPAQSWRVEVRVSLDENAQTRADVEVALLEGIDLGRTGRRARRLLERLDTEVGADERTRIVPGPASALALAAILTFGATACDPPPPPEAETPVVAGDTVAAPVRATPLRTYERAIAFRATETDSALAVVWLFRHADLGDAVRRSTRGFLLRAETWDLFLDERTDDPASTVPWRLVPTGPMRLVVGDGDRIDRVIFEADDRLLDLGLEGGGARWTGANGGTFDVESGSVVFGDRAFAGVAVDLSRARSAEEPPLGDWVFLTSGDSVVVLLQARTQTRDRDGFQGWALRGGREILLPEVTLEWTDTRAMDAARRDVPIAWSVASREGDLDGSISVLSADLRPGEGTGPLLPVEGVLEVGGTISLEGTDFRVRGILRHQQGGEP